MHFVNLALLKIYNLVVFVHPDRCYYEQENMIDYYRGFHV